jgi:hypothetical protein
MPTTLPFRVRPPGTKSLPSYDPICRVRNTSFIPTGFLSVSLSEAGAEHVDDEPRRQVRARLDAHWLMDRFFASTRWHPDLAVPVAGALQYSKYPPVLRLLMQQIARAQGGDVDTSRDHEYTDWAELDRFAERFGEKLAGVPWPRAVEPPTTVPA